MDVFGRTETHGPDIIILHDVEHLKGGDALSVGRKFPDVIPPVVDRNGVDPLRGVFLKVAHGQESPVFLHIKGDFSGDFPLVENIPASVGDGFQGSGQPGISEDFSLCGGLALRHEDFGEARVFAEAAGIGLPVVSDEFADRESLAGIPYGRGQEVGHGQSPEAVVEFIPAVDAPWNRYGEGAKRRNPGDVIFAEPFEGEGMGTAATGVKSVKFAAFLVPDDGEEISPDAVPCGFHQS